MKQVLNVFNLTSNFEIKSWATDGKTAGYSNSNLRIFWKIAYSLLKGKKMVEYYFFMRKHYLTKNTLLETEDCLLAFDTICIQLPINRRLEKNVCQ